VVSLSKEKAFGKRIEQIKRIKPQRYLKAHGSKAHAEKLCPRAFLIRE